MNTPLWIIYLDFHPPVCHGLPAQETMYVLTIPITGTFFAKRNWLTGKRYGFITPGDMFAYYYNNEAVRWLTVLAAFLYSIFYSGLRLITAAKLFYWVAGKKKSGIGSTVWMPRQKMVNDGEKG